MKALISLAVLFPLLGCPNPGGPGVAGSTEGCVSESCRHSNVSPVGGASGGSSSPASTSSGASTASSTSSSTPGGSSSTGSGGSSSGTTAGTDAYYCDSHPPLPDGGSCPNGSFATQLLDLISCTPVPGASVQALDANAVPVSGGVETADGGIFLLCGPPSTAFTPFITAQGYPTTYLAELRSDAQSTYLQFGILSNEFENGFAALLPGGADPSLGLLIAYVETSPICPDPTNWQISLTDSDGGAIADGGYLETYLGASGVPDPSLTSTSKEGIALIYNIDLSATNFFSLALQKPDAGACAPTSVLASFTGRIYVAANSISIDSLQVPGY